MQKDIYILLANQLKDIHHRLSVKIIENKQHKPSWEVVYIPVKNGTPVPLVGELSEIKSLIITLENLAGGNRQEVADFMIPNREEGENQ